MAQHNSTQRSLTLDPSILAELHDLPIRPATEIQQGGQNKGRSALYNKLYPNEKNPICPRQRDNYQPGEHHFHYCPYAESGLCKDYAPPCRRPSLNGPAIPQGQHKPQLQQEDSQSYNAWLAELTGGQPHKTKNVSKCPQSSILEDQIQDRNSTIRNRSRNQRNQHSNVSEIVEIKAKRLPNQRDDNFLPKRPAIPHGQHNKSLPQLQQEDSPQGEESFLSFNSFITDLPKKMGAPKINAPITKEVIDLRYPKGPQRPDKGRSFTDNLLSQYTEKPKSPKKRATYKLGNKTYFYCPYAGLYTDEQAASKPSSNQSAIPQSQQSSRPVTDVPKPNVNEATCSQKQSQDCSFRPVTSRRGKTNVQFQNLTGDVSSKAPRQGVAQNQNVTKQNEQSSARMLREQHQLINEAKIAKIVYDYFQNEQKKGRSSSQIDVQRQNINEAEIAKIVYDYFQKEQKQRRSTNEAEIANIVYNYFQNEQNTRRSSSQNGDQRRNINIPEMLNTVRQFSQGKQAVSGSLDRQPDRRNGDMADGNRPPRGSLSLPQSYAGAGCNQRRNEAAAQNRKQPPLDQCTDKPKKKSAFTLTDEQKALILDNYYPGLIHDAVNQNVDFNEIAKRFVTPETAVDGNKAEKGMSLIEAFDMRCKYEQINLTKLLGRSPETVSKAKRGAKPNKTIHGPLAHPVVSDILLEDNVRASAIPIDLEHYVRATPESDPVRAIACLTRAQQLNDYYKEYKAAQMAAHLVPSDKIEEAAVQGVKSFKIDSLSAKTKTVETEFYKSLELVSYIGVTKPD